MPCRPCATRAIHIEYAVVDVESAEVVATRAQLPVVVDQHVLDLRSIEERCQRRRRRVLGARRLCRRNQDECKRQNEEEVAEGFTPERGV